MKPDSDRLTGLRPPLCGRRGPVCREWNSSRSSGFGAAAMQGQEA
jgi:hypothetical protein